MEFPEQFNEDVYVKWHEQEFPTDKPLRARKLDDLRINLMKESKEDLIFLSSFIKSILPQLQEKYQETILTATFESEHLEMYSQEKYFKELGDLDNKLFKQPDSIIEKLWRTNKKVIKENSKSKHQEKMVSLSNIKEKFTDLIRTEIICSSLGACKYLSDNFKEGVNYLRNNKTMENNFHSYVDKIECEPELKMESGYFAYHGLVYFKNKITLEIQFHSSLSSGWRKLSHDLYKNVRINPIESHEYGTIESRIISLGHLLYVADYQLDSLIKESNSKSKKTE